MLSRAIEERPVPLRFAVTQQGVTGAREMARILNTSTGEPFSSATKERLFAETTVVVVTSNICQKDHKVLLFVATTEHTSHYSPAMVERLLHADVAKPEATFTNVIDMMEWLDRD